jgi:diacylglycerol kinase family enzyme
VRLRLIVNPVASSVTTHARDPIADALSAEHDLDVVETAKRGDAAQLARDAAEKGVEVVVVLAGDGTLNEAASGIAGTTTALAALPGGSTNVFARTLGVTHNVLAATKQLLRALAARSFRRVGVGVVGHAHGFDRPFLFHLGAGFDAAVVAQMEQRSYLKRYLAHPAFAIATVDTWLRHYDRSTAITVTGDSAVLGSAPYVVVSNSDPYTYVFRRPLTIAPGADLAAALAITIVRDLRPSLLVHAAASGLSNARFLEGSPDITQCTDVRDVVLASEQPFPWQVDGDYLGYASRLVIRYEPEYLTLVIP